MNKITIILFILINSVCIGQLSDTSRIVVDGDTLIKVSNTDDTRLIVYQYKNNPKIINGSFRYTSYIKNDTLIETGSYLNNTPNGVFITISNKDTLKCVEYDDGKLDGQFMDKKYFSDTLELMRIGKYSDGNRVKEWKYYANNTLIAKGKYSRSYINTNNLNEDSTELLLNNSKLLCVITSNGMSKFLKEYNYPVVMFDKNYLRRGKWYFYNLDDVLIKTVVYGKDGKEQKVKSYNESGKTFFNYLIY